MKGIRYCLSALIFLSLCACQQHLAVKAQETEKIRKTKEAAQYYTQLGVGYINQKDYPRAKRKLLMALKLAPNAPETNAAMGYYLEKTDDLPGAKGYYQKALSVSPTSGTQKNNYGAFLCRTGQYEQGLALLQQAGEDVHYINSAMAYENAGFCAELMHNDVLSQDFFTKALMQDPARKTALYELVQLSMKHNDTARTLKMLKQYALLTTQEPLLLRIGVEAARKNGLDALAADYEQRLHAMADLKQIKTEA